MQTLLILGGTRFLGRHLTAAALELGFAVTLFTRGRHTEPLDERVTHLTGDRDPRIAPGLAALRGGRWDIVIDCSGYVPRIVGASVDLLESRCERYVFVSSVSVYADLSEDGVDESAPLLRLEDRSIEDIAGHYGALKAACEEVVTARLGSRALIARPGLIVGPFDPTDRFTYWAARFGAPNQLGARPPSAVMFGPPERAIQLIDARDLALWMLQAAQLPVAGAFNLTSAKGRWQARDLAHAGQQLAAQQGLELATIWATDAELTEHGVIPWTGLGLWLPENDSAFAGLQGVQTQRALAHGLVTREILESLTDTANWLRDTAPPGRFGGVMSGAIEQALLDALSGTARLV